MLNKSQWSKVPPSWNTSKQGKLPFKIEQLVQKFKPLYKSNKKRTITVDANLTLNGVGSYEGFFMKTTETDSIDRTIPIKGSYTEVMTTAQKLWEKMKHDDWSETVQEEIHNLTIHGRKFPFPVIKSVGIENFTENYKIVIVFKDDERKEYEYKTLEERNEEYKLILFDLYDISTGKKLRENNPIRN